MHQNILLVYNPNSGFFIGWKLRDITNFFSSLFKDETDIKFKLFRFSPQKSKSLISRLKVDQPDSIWVAGGDGTITSILGIRSAFNIPLGILPVGTMNLLARDMGINLNLQSAISQLKTALPVFIDMAFVNTKPFLNICNIGVSTNFTEMREKFRHRAAWIRWPLLLWYMMKSVFIYPAMIVDVTINNHSHRFRTRSVSITNNPLSRDSILFPSRDNIQQGMLGFYIAKENSVWSLPILMIKLLLGNWSYDEDLKHFRSPRATIAPKHKRRLKVMIDGELYRFKGPLNFRIEPDAIQMLKPVKDT